MDEYTGPERRMHPRDINEAELMFDRKLRDHEIREEERIKKAIEALVGVAFPEGAQKHGEYHQAKINAAKEEAEFWKAAKMELTKVGVSALVGVVKTVIILAFIGLLYKLGLGAFAGEIIK